MYSIIISLAVIGQTTEVDRNTFNSIKPNSAFSAEAPEVPNRLVEDKALREKIVEKVKTTSEKYEGNPEYLQKRFTNKKVLDWIYGLKEIKGGLTSEEQVELANIISKELEIKPLDVTLDKNPPNTTVNRQWLIALHKGQRIPIWGWIDSGTNKYKYYLHEQYPEIQKFLSQ